MKEEVEFALLIRRTLNETNDFKQSTQSTELALFILLGIFRCHVINRGRPAQVTSLLHERDASSSLSFVIGVIRLFQRLERRRRFFPKIIPTTVNFKSLAQPD